MKNKLIFVLTFLFIIYVCALYIRLNENKKINNMNEVYIKKEIFSKDSDNRGYSDEAKKLMDEDLALMDNDKYIYKLYIKKEKELRKVALSHNHKEFYQNYIKTSNVWHCLGTLINEKYPNIYAKNFLSKDSSEKKQINQMLNYLHNKYAKYYTWDEHIDITMKATNLDEEKCEKILNE